MTTQSNDKKIVEFKKYYAKCQEIENGFKLQIENDIITLNEVREKREKMTKSLEKLVLEIHTSNINQGKGKDQRWFTPIMKGGKRVIMKKEHLRRNHRRTHRVLWCRKGKNHFEKFISAMDNEYAKSRCFSILSS